MAKYERFFVDSSFLKHVSWESKTKLLIVTFSSGSIWGYRNIPRKKYREFCESSSLGAYFNKNIRNFHEGFPIARVGDKGIIVYTEGGDEIVSAKQEETQEQVR
jgi:glutamine amidotransferase-like uncharacterized protein